MFCVLTLDWSARPIHCNTILVVVIIKVIFIFKSGARRAQLHSFPLVWARNSFTEVRSLIWHAPFLTQSVTSLFLNYLHCMLGCPKRFFEVLSETQSCCPINHQWQHALLSHLYFKVGGSNFSLFECDCGMFQAQTNFKGHLAFVVAIRLSGTPNVVMFITFSSTPLPPLKVIFSACRFAYPHLSSILLGSFISERCPLIISSSSNQSLKKFNHAQISSFLSFTILSYPWLLPFQLPEFPL